MRLTVYGLIAAMLVVSIQGTATSRSIESEPSAQAGSAPPQKRRREPPPFDRPAGGSSGNVPAQPRQSQSQSQQNQSQPGDVDSNRDRTGPRGERPTLGRSGEPREGARNDRQPSESSEPAAEPGEPVKLNAALVNIPVLVSDRSGRYIPRLTAKDFEILEDGAKQEVAFFANEQVPFNVALLLDVSPSVSSNLEDIQDAAIEFVRQLRPDDRVMIASFDRRLRVLTGFTSDRRELEFAIRSTQTGNGTSVYEAVYDTVVNRLAAVEGRKALILFSDGEDTTSRRVSYREAVDSVSEADVLVYGLRYPGSDSSGGGSGGTWNIPLPLPLPIPWPRRPGGRGNRYPDPFPRSGGGSGDFMSDVTTAGGGPVYDAESIGDLSRVARQIAEELRNVYVVSYYPTNSLANGGYRSIRVRVRTRGDLAVRHRRGYNAEEVDKKRTS